MAVMGTFSQYNTARLALYASQASLTVTGNNISNINTTGYTRQRMDLVSLYSGGQGKYANVFNTNVGYGVLTNGVTRLRDPYLDIRYRNMNSKLGSSDGKSNALYQIGNILDEVGKGTDGFGVIEAQFGELFQALENLETHIGSEEYDDLVRGAATTLTAFFRKAASELETVRLNEVGELTDTLTDFNSLLTQIRDLNQQIRTQAIYGNSAPELRDARDMAIDKLSGYIPINVTYSMERIDQWTEVEKLTITIKDSKDANGMPIKLVDGVYGAQVTMPGRMPEVNSNYDADAIKNTISSTIEQLNKSKPATATQANEDDLVDYVYVPPKDVNYNYPRDAGTPAVGGHYYDPDNPNDPDSPNDPVLEAAWQQVISNTANINRVDKSIQSAIDRLKLAWDEYNAAVEADDPNAEKLKPAEKEVSDATKNAIADAILRPLMKEAVQQAAIDVAAEEGNAKYKVNVYDEDGNIVKDENGDPVVKWTNDIDEASSGNNGTYNYDPKDPINSNAVYLGRVEELVDERGRVMDDKDDPTGKSQIIALDDVTFCTKNSNGSISETRVDSNALGSIQAIREALIRKGEYSTADEIERDPYATNKRGAAFYERALDSLARKFADVFNQMNQMPLETIYGFEDPSEKILDADGKQLLDAGGQPLTWGDVVDDVPILDDDLNPVKDADGNTVKQYQFKPDADTAAKIALVQANAKKAEGYEFYDGGVLISNNGDNNDPTDITAANISVSNAWSTHTVRVLTTTQKSEVDENGNITDHTTAGDNIQHMLTQFDRKRDYFAKDILPEANSNLAIFHGSFREVFTSISGILATDVETTYIMEENYSSTIVSLDNDRQSVAGVDLNEEATSMMVFSKSYAAACRLLTTIDSMLDTLINGTAR